MSEPSNPWVSGVSGLFTTEFYGRIRQYLTDDGVFGQWLHVYELDDQLVLSVLAAIHQNFPSYEIFLVPSGDLLVVASRRDHLPEPDWSVFRSSGLRGDLCRFVPLTPPVLNSLHIAGRAELAPLLELFGRPNSDYYPVLDLGAERRRFRHDHADGFPALSSGWFNLLSSLSGRRVPPGGDVFPALPENPRVSARAIGAFLRSPAAMMPGDTAFGPVSRSAVFQWRLWEAGVASGRAPSNWELWVEQANSVDQLRNGGTAGTADEAFYTTLTRFMEQHDAPQPARDVVAFRRGLASWDFAPAAAAALRLIPVAIREHRWIPADELRDGLVIAEIHLRDVSMARQALDSLRRFSARPAGDLRSQLLDAYVQTLEHLRPEVARR